MIMIIVPPYAGISSKATVDEEQPAAGSTQPMSLITCMTYVPPVLTRGSTIVPRITHAHTTPMTPQVSNA